MTVIMLIAKKVHLHQVWDLLDLGHLLLILLEQRGLSLGAGVGQGDLCLGGKPQGRGGAAGILQERMRPPGFPVQLESRKPSGKSQDGFCGCQTHPINMEDTDSLHHINRLCCQKFL